MTSPRYPSGEVKHSREDQTLVAKLGRLNSMPELLKEIGRPEWGTELTKLHVKGTILETQKRAGEEWAELVFRHRRIVLDAPSGLPKVARMEKVRGRGTRTYEDDLIERTAKQYDQAFCAVVDSGREGVRMMKAVNALCIENEHLLYDQLLLAKEGLNKLAEHFGLTGVSKYARSGNTHS